MNRSAILSVLAILAVLCLLTGCGEKDVHPDSDNPPPAETETAEAPAAPVGENQFVFTRDNFPRLDGSTSTLPLGQAVASVLLGEPRAKVSDFIRFSKTARSYRALMNGEADVLLAAEPAPVVWAEKDDGGYDWDMAPFAVDALVFVVNAANPVESLTRDQLRGIYSGTITNWAEVGGEDLDIVPFQRDEEAGSQTAMMNLVMMGEPMTDAPTELVTGEMGDLVTAVAAFDDTPAAIGYTMYYYAHNMNMADGLKILSVDGVAPDAETIRNGSYPFLNSYYVVTDAGRSADDPAKLLYDWILSEDGRRLIEHEGYVPVPDTGGGTA
ncbi:MAG: substrate-binding domain-containing protein [Oscillibacter sp.]|nr:substrate-binding domain-containing protein [Oscillibacter sp.]